MALESARQASRFFLSRIAAQIEGLSTKRYPGDHSGPREWLALISGVVETAQSYLDLSEEAGKPLAEAQELVRDAGRLAKLSYDYLNMMRGTSIDDLPYPIVLPMQRWFDSAKLDYSTIFRAELVANYEIRPFDRSLFDRIRNQSPTLVQAIQKIRWPLRRITVPSKALGMLPHFAIVAHEIGHAIFPNVGWDFSKYAAEETALDQRIQAALGGAPLSHAVLLYKREVFLSWLQEIASDAFGYYMAGPAFFFALCGFLETVGAGVGISESHPPNELRRDLLFQRLQNPPARNYVSVFGQRLNVPLTKELSSELLVPLPPPAQLIADLTNQLRPTPTLSSKEKAVVLTELILFVRAIADQVYLQAEVQLQKTDPKLIYTVDQFEEDIQHHVDPLTMAIPPIETGGVLESRNASEFATILNVGWIVLLTKLDQLAVKPTPGIPVATDKAEKLHSLLLKAVELSEARRSWEAAK
jgi:hypothetical protein